MALDCFSGNFNRMLKVKEIFGDYLTQRGYLEEGAAMYMNGNALEKAQETYLKCTNIPMIKAIIAIRGLKDEESKEVMLELVDLLE